MFPYEMPTTAVYHQIQQKQVLFELKKKRRGLILLES